MKAIVFNVAFRLRIIDMRKTLYSAFSLILFSGLFLISLTSALSQPAQSSQSVEIHGNVVNGTRGNPVSPEKLELIRPGEQMTVLHTMDSPSPAFRFPPVERVSVPFLIRATYQGETYVAVVPPVPERQNASQTVQVFDAGATEKDLNIMPGVELLNEVDGLRINLVYSIENASTPPRTYAGDQFQIRIPNSVKITGCQLAHQSSRMPAPFSCGTENGAILVPKGFRPGSSQLTIQLEQDGRRYTDPETAYPFKVVVWKPEKAKPDIQNEKSVEELNIRGLGPALKVDYASSAVEYEMPDDSFHYANPLQSDYNPVFESSFHTTLAVLAIVAIILLSISVLSSFRIQIRRNR